MVGSGVAVGAAMGVGVGVAVAVGSGVAVGVGVGVAVGLGVGVGMSVGGGVGVDWQAIDKTIASIPASNRKPVCRAGLRCLIGRSLSCLLASELCYLSDTIVGNQYSWDDVESAGGMARRDTERR